jgi:hypothetical protein
VAIHAWDLPHKPVFDDVAKEIMKEEPTIAARQPAVIELEARPYW